MERLFSYKKTASTICVLSHETLVLTLQHVAPQLRIPSSLLGA